MSKTYQVLTAIVISTALLAGLLPAPAQAQTVSGDGGFFGQPLCLPDGATAGSDCLPLGPGARLAELAAKGLTVPLKPLPASKPDAALNEINYAVAKLNIPATEAAPVYATLDEAASGGTPTRTIDPGPTRYVSIVQVQRVNDKPYVQLTTGEWMRASPAGYPRFQGLVFKRTPTNSFGWIVDFNTARSAPGYTSPEVGEVLVREQVVQIYDIQSADGVDWYQIGVNRWVERRYIRQVRINTRPPEGVQGNRWIDVNLYDQTLAVYENDQLVFATMVATGGEPYWTRPGVFQIYKKFERNTMSGSFEPDRSDWYYLEDVPWTMYFDEARALHGAYWRAWFGYEGTHGCVNLSVGDSHWLFDWAVEGDYVHVWDPSGRTPVDPTLYGAGGA